MRIDRTDAICLGAVALHVALVGFFYAELPDPLPTHWNAAGEVDGYTPKPWGAWLLPLMTLGVYLLFKVIPWISPQGFRMESFSKIVDILKLVIVLFMFVIGITVLFAARGAPFDPGKIILPGVGVLFIIIGNYMGKLRKNFFIGIRTPWTLASDEVWAKTHRLGGWCFVFAGLVLLIAGLIGWPPMEIVLVVAVGIGALLPIVYSFVIYKQLEGFEPDKD
ncbi:MAG: SdpI family protein [Gammaproteobacteria bacterium]|nr:SdpI family protein [Gammaproteobacteria bacterium]